MSRRCEVSGTKPLYGQNVSHSNRKTKRRYEVNLHTIRIKSDILGYYIRLKLSHKGLRTLDKHYGLDNYLLSTASSRLTEEMKGIKKLLLITKNEGV